MRLSPREQEKMMVYLAAQIARDRKGRGLKLNYPESVALIAAELMEDARDGKSVSEAMSHGAEILTSDDVMEGVPEMLQRRITPVRNTRNLGKKDMLLNDYVGEIKVDPETYEVRVDGGYITCEPASELSLTQRYFLF